MYSVKKQCILSVYSVYTQPMSCILGGLGISPQCIIHKKIRAGNMMKMSMNLETWATRKDNKFGKDVFAELHFDKLEKISK